MKDAIWPTLPNFCEILSLPLPASLCFCFLFVWFACVCAFIQVKMHMCVPACGGQSSTTSVRNYLPPLTGTCGSPMKLHWLASKHQGCRVGIRGTCHHTWLFCFLTWRLNSGSHVCKASSRQALYPLGCLLRPSLKCVILPQTMCSFLYLYHEYILKFKGTRIPRCSLNITKAKKERDA